MNILSIQSHVCYGYVGNKAASFPLQSMGFEVWPVNTVQFSNHTGYGHWQGDIFSAEHIRAVLNGLLSLDLAKQCDAILSGYLGDKTIGQVIVETVKQFRQFNPELIYLCDPVMATPNGKGCFVKPDIPDFFRDFSLEVATIITPNHFETEILYGEKINNLKTLQQACHFFHGKGIRVVVVTSLMLEENKDPSTSHPIAFISSKNGQWLASVPTTKLNTTFNGTGDLFSALYLGHFLYTKDPIISFSLAMNKTYQVTEITRTTKQRELKILGNDYKQAAPNYVMLKQL